MREDGTYKSIGGERYRAEIYLDPYSSRARLLEYQGDPEKLIYEMLRICLEHNFGKLICYTFPRDRDVFLRHDFSLEGKLSGFFKGESADCFSYFLNHRRTQSSLLPKEDEIIAYCAKYKLKRERPDSTEHLRTAQKEDAEKIASLFQEVFPLYPSPMDRPNYVRHLMEQDVLFKMIEIDGAPVSVAAADMNPKFLHAEITDCATLEPFRGNGYLSKLIFSLEKDLKSMGYLTAFSLARARSYGINIVLSSHGYKYSGRNINNCRIMNGFEDMNIWVKQLQE